MLWATHFNLYFYTCNKSNNTNVRAAIEFVIAETIEGVLHICLTTLPYTFLGVAFLVYRRSGVQSTSELEGTIFLQLIGGDANNALDHGLHVLRLQPTGLSDGAVRLRRGHGAAGGLHRLHRFHCLHGCHLWMSVSANVCTGVLDGKASENLSQCITTI
jgi:hypothetical protein